MERQIQTRPMRLPRSVRKDEWRGLTSARAGEIVPIAYFPLLREDAIRGRIMVQVKMEEALHTIINPIKVVMQAHLIPKTALARFDGSLEVLNRSYMGETLPGGGASPPWHVLDPNVATQGDDDLGHAIYDKLGIHYKSTTKIHSDLLESYWTMVNWRRAAVSKALPKEVVTANKLAPAFWDSWKFDHIKPSFDAAMMEGVVPVGLSGTVPVVGELVKNSPEASGTTFTQVGHDGNTAVPSQNAYMLAMREASTGGFPLYVDYASSSAGATISLANIETAKKTQQWAKMRERYQGIPDEYLIDLLMQGIQIPPEDFREPILIGRAMSVIGQTERYATDGASLDQSVTNGVTQLSMTINTPAVSPGGIVLVTMEIVPEQLYERIGDLGLMMDATGTAEWLPNAMEDYLDPQKVEVVPNKYADSFHSDPDGIFGYAPLNHGWQRSIARVGGRYKRPVPDAFVEDRQRIWAVEKTDPSLSEDFYLCPQPFPHTVFADADADPFEIITIGQTSIRGLTVFGPGFMEDDDHYEKIMAQIDLERIESVPTTTGAEADASEGSEPQGGDTPAGE
ncbi:MAG: major capsid protein [Arizlama microvirus]|nr:MAG: major capsid protein [Arizlama microvirus]